MRWLEKFITRQAENSNRGNSFANINDWIKIAAKQQAARFLFPQYTPSSF